MTTLDFIFGADSIGVTPVERAATSTVAFVRSQVQLALDSPEATGRKLTATEALDAFGLDVLEEVVDREVVSLVRDSHEPARTFRKRRQYLRLSPGSLAAAAGVTADEVRALEQPGIISSAHVIERVAQHLALDERVLGAVPMARADSDLATRLREFNEPEVRDDGFIIALADASWVIRRQHELLHLLRRGGPTLADEIKGDTDYRFPTYQRGYDLASRTRAMLGLDAIAPIEDLHALAEDRIGVILVETDFGPGRAGATITNGDVRGIALTEDGANHNPLVRRTTLAHELGHLLWDTRGNLERVRVERSRPGRDERDPVEMRAKAFAVALLAPPAAVEAIHRETGDPTAAVAEIVRRYGIHSDAAAHHLVNICRLRREDVEVKAVPRSVVRLWRDREARAEPYGGLIRQSRAGRFATLVLEAVGRGLVTRDTARTWLLVDDGALTELLAIAGIDAAAA